MDGNIHVAEVKVSGGWKTVLAAGMGKGAKGLFALDVTQPDHFMAGNGVLFEFTEKDDPDIGYVTSAPAIAKMNTGKDKNGNIIYTYFVMVTSGYHSAGVHSNSGEDTTREHFLFLLSLDKNPMVPWSKNDNYYKISIDSNDTTTGNALSAPGLVLNTQRAVTYAYLGDLQGNLWRLDFRKDNPNATSPKLIFTAKDTHNNPQPITTQPIVSFAPKGGYLILFGTGNQEENARQKKSNHFHNSFYAIRDTTKSSKEDYFVTGRSQLAIRELVKTNSNEKLGYRVIGKEFTFGQSQSDKKGWYFDYPSGYQNGSRTETRCNERSVTEGFFAYETIFFNTVIPASTMCNESSTARSYSLNALTGKADTPNNLTGFESKVGTLGVPIIIAKQLKKSNPDFIGRQFNTQHYLVLNFGTGGANGSFEVSNASTAPLKAGRLSWREISNWQDLK
jgi:type IV pilus assembly protein PilY1